MSSEFELDRGALPRELNLLLFFLRRDSGEDELLVGELFQDIDWNRFIQLANHHRIYPCVYQRIMELADERVPKFVVQRLNQEYRRNTFQMLHLSSEMKLVSRMLAERNIRSLFLKGPVLASDLYGDVSLRTSCDLDILVPIQDLDRTEALLLEDGYIKDDYIVTVLRDWKWRHHHITFFHPVKQIKLEIHWRLNPGPSKEPSFHELWARRRTSSFTGYPVNYLGRNDLFFYLVSHGARHGWSRLRWLLDIDRIVKQGLDWPTLKKHLHTYQHLHIAGQVLILASQLLHTPLVSESRSLVNSKRSIQLTEKTVFYLKQMVNLHTLPVPVEVAKYHKGYLFALMSVQQKGWFILSFLYPYPSDAELLPLPRRLHFLYFPLRPFLWAWRKTKKQRVSIGG